MSTETASLTETLINNISTAILGKREPIRLALVALLGEGHLLVEDAPGVGKTSLAKAIASSIHCEYSRLQFTPDMLPSDILGTSVFLPNKEEFEFRQGPIFTNVLLADEINRTTPRTQSALLEAMSERQVSIDGKTYQLKRPFFVMATQNPFEFEGTYVLPENQLDRFMLRIEIGYPDRDVERDVLQSHRLKDPVSEIKHVLDSEDVIKLQQQVREVTVDESIHDYILDLVTATRQDEELTTGVSTRGAITMSRAVQAYALLDGRDYVQPDDVKTLAIPVFAHRISVAGLIREGQRTRAVGIMQKIIDQTPVPE